jgi:hypothetical protein
MQEMTAKMQFADHSKQLSKEQEERIAKEIEHIKATLAATEELDRVASDFGDDPAHRNRRYA